MKSISLIAKMIGVIAVVLLCVAPTFGQLELGAMGGGMGGGLGGGMGMVTPLESLKEALRTAKGDAAQQKVLSKIKSLLSKQYDEYLQTNELELQAMEQSVKALRAQLERRKKAKGQLLSLELQRISNEATGLVWPEPPTGMGGMGMGGMMGRGSGMGGFASRIVEDDYVEHVEPESVTTDEPEVDTVKQLMQITRAAHKFETDHKVFPGNIKDADGKPLLSWRVAILKFMGEPEQELYEKFKIGEAWNSKHNIQLLDKMPDVYRNARFNSSTKTVYLGFDGEGTMFESNKTIGFANIRDGSSNTLFVAQLNRQSAIEWSKPADIKFTPGTAVSQLAETEKGFIVVASCDGSAAFTSLENIDAEEMEHFIQRNDGEVISLGE